MTDTMTVNRELPLINIIGAGNLGKTIGYLLAKNRLAIIGAICNRSEKSGLEAIKFIGQGKYYSKIEELPLADITLITTPDDLISTICEKLSKNIALKQGSIIVHCSGFLSSDILISTSEKGCYKASIHPMKSFAKPEWNIKDYQGTYCAVEGDDEALPLLCSLFNSIGSITYKINKHQKPAYHAAGVFASNYLVTLANQALSCMNQIGVDEEIAISAIINLMQGTLNNLKKTTSPVQSLTGPIKRADIATIKNHLESLADRDLKQLYSALGKATLKLTSHDEETRKRIETALLHF
jgi:predicted short-subunit dehydrogenase-like oxidoreductase (DUF2520 family)